MEPVIFNTAEPEEASVPVVFVKLPPTDKLSSRVTVVPPATTLLKTIPPLVTAPEVAPNITVPALATNPDEPALFTKLLVIVSRLPPVVATVLELFVYRVLISPADNARLYTRASSIEPLK